MLKLTLACGLSDRTIALSNGRVKPDGVELTFLASPPSEETFRRMLKDNEFDISEMSLSSYIVAKSINMPFIAIPVFPNRKFRHSSI